MKGMFNLTWSNVKSALIYGVLSLVVMFLYTVGNSIIDAGTIFGLDWKAILDKGVVESLSVFVFGVSILKNLLTNNRGEFLGLTEVIPDKK